MKRGKAKFSVGQVVHVSGARNGEPIYDKVIEVKVGIGYRLDWWDWTHAIRLRPLTTTEATGIKR